MINNYDLVMIKITNNIIWFVFQISDSQIYIYLNNKDTTNIFVFNNNHFKLSINYQLTICLSQSFLFNN